nr:aminotransferase class V-fold PLP-dependent enzyme [Chloroflexota bacterium]
MVASLPPDADRLAVVRAALPALEAGIYLNTGSVGPLPAETAAAMTEIAAYELTTGRAHAEYFSETLQRMAEARAAVAAVLVADSADIGLTHSTTDGMNIGTWAVDWMPG